MSVFLDHSDSDGGPAAQTGNLVHSAAAAFHQNGASAEAGLAALEAARQQFPRGDAVAARKRFGAYAADPQNATAKVPYVEHRVKLVLAPAHDDPTGEPIVIEGTLDQIRLDFDDGRGKSYPGLTVWDIKNGDRLDSNESLDEHRVQQAVYVLAARQSLGKDVQAGGLILMPGYDKPRGRRFIPWTMSLDLCMLVCAPIVQAVSLVRQGIPVFRSSPDNCRYCEVKPFPHCASMYRGLYGSNGP
jgi:hypothetical protein